MNLTEAWRTYGIPRYRTLPERVRWSIALGIEILLAIAVWFLDHALTYAVLTLAALYWIHRINRSGGRSVRRRC